MITKTFLEYLKKTTVRVKLELPSSRDDLQETRFVVGCSKGYDDSHSHRVAMACQKVCNMASNSSLQDAGE